MDVDRVSDAVRLLTVRIVPVLRSDRRTGIRAYLPANGQGKYEFGTADFEAGTHNTICTLDKPWSLCAFDEVGNLYAIDVDGDFYTVDKSTGTMTLVGPTGISSQYMGGGVYDSRSNRILWSVCNDLSSGLYSVDPKTGEASLVYEFPNNEEVLGMFIGTPIAADGAPERVDDLTAEFTNGSKTGTISFTVPTTSFDGKDAEGEVTWKLTMSTANFSNMQVAAGTAQCGEHVEAPVTAFSNGSTTFTLSLSNAAGKGPDSKVTTFIGYGTPHIPVVYLDYNEETEQATLTWQPITKTYDAGYINPDEITYTVTRYPDMKIVASHIKECTVVDDLPIPSSVTTYHYTVVAENGDVVSGTGNTLPLRLGTYGVPYIENFNDMNTISDFTTYDVNKDQVSWTYAIGGITLYSSQNFAMDDWLLTPGITLKGGHKYYVELTFRTLQMAAPYADVEVKFGKNNTLEALTEQLIPLTQITELTAEPFSTIVEADTDSKYYIGFHALSESSNWVQIQQIVIKEATMPGKVTDLKVTPGPDDALDAIVEFKAPTTDAAGDPISSIDRIEVSRGGMLIQPFNNPAPGEVINFEDAVYSPGDYQWTVTAYNENGTGLQASIIEYVGLDVPAMPQNVKAVEDGNTGRVTLTWDPVTTGQHGRPMSPEFIKYRIINRGAYIDIMPDVTGNTYTVQLTEPGQQDFAQLGLQVYSDRGSNVAITQVMPVGAPYKEYKESFAAGLSGHTIAISDVENYAQWSIHTDGAMTGPGSVDGDEGYIMMTGQYIDGASTLHIGKFNLADCHNPEFGISMYNYGDEGDFNRNIIKLLVDKGQGYEEAGVCEFTADDKNPGWKRFRIDLSKYAGAGDIRIALRGHIVNYTFVPADKISIGSTYDNDVAPINFATPAKVKAESSFGITVDVENNGRNKAENVSVTLLQNGKEVETKDVEAIEPDEMQPVSFSCKVSSLVGEAVDFSAVVNYEADENKADNTTATNTVTVKQTIYPAPGTLSAEVSDGNVTLSWEEPSKEIPAPETLESFENGEAYAIDNYEDWTFVDGDGDMTYNYGNFYVGCQSPKAYVVFDYAVNAPTDVAMAAHSGDRYLASVCTQTGVTNDDWAISPELSGDAQTVSFFARSLWDQDGGESFEFLYSTTDTSVESFTKVETVDNVPAAWTEYSYDLPAGARYFAIRCVSNYQYMFMLDDVTYVSAGAAMTDLEHQGYHVYRDEARINETLVTERTHTDAPAEDGDYTYTVTAMYNKGESVPTNRVLVTVAHDGIGDATVSAVTVTGGIGTITVTGADGLDVTVSDMAGRIVAATKGNLHATVPAGCYLVKAGTRTTKIMVK